MRKIFKIVFIFVLLFLNVIPCKADNISVTKYFLENGDYIEIELIQDNDGFFKIISHKIWKQKNIIQE